MSKYGNFADPYGLVFRMICLRQRAAYHGLLREGLKLPAKPLDWLFSKFATGSPAAEKSYPLVLVVGPPRSGTTLTYQLLAGFCHVTYPSNLQALFPKSSTNFLKWFGDRDCGKGRISPSCYGTTAGFSGPNEAFYIWDRWFGKDRYQSDFDAGDEVATAEMRDFFATWTSIAGRPFVNKNNRSTACLSTLCDVLPNAYIVLLNRDCKDVIRSLVRGREFVQGNREYPWGLLSQDKHGGEKDPLGYIDDVCEQLFNIRAMISQQAERVSPDRLIRVSYADLCRQPQLILKEVADKVPDFELRQDRIDRKLKPFTISTGHLLSPDEERRIDEAIERSGIDCSIRP